LCCYWGGAGSGRGLGVGASNFYRVPGVVLSSVKKSKKVKCLGFIMDGNRRWAKENGLSRYAGHQRGMEVFLDSVSWVREAGLTDVVYYAFSTENWKRSKVEVASLMMLFREILSRLEAKLIEEKVRVRILGRRDDFAADLIKRINTLEQKSLEYKNAKTTIWIALSYGGRTEIVEAVNQAVRQGKMVPEETFARALWTADLPDPDLIVRTSGEQRLSNFLTWKAVYSELLFIDKHWPALTKSDFEAILTVYEARDRRQGK
jgi:undecaprenyl diphosphate synthase